MSRPITREIANKEINQFMEVSEPLNEIITSTVTKLFPDRPEIENFYSSKYNAFLFEREDIERFFHGKEGSEEATHLMVILGAHFEDKGEFKKGSPTVIVAGVIPKDKSEKEFRTLTSDHPADEYPTRIITPRLPLQGNDLEFSIV